MSHNQKLNGIVKEIVPKDELGIWRVEGIGQHFHSNARARRHSCLCDHRQAATFACRWGGVSVTMRSIAWGVGDLNTLISTQTSTMSNNQDVRPRYAREALAFELDTTVRERVLALRVDIAAEVESE